MASKQEWKELNYKIDNLKALLMGNGKIGISEMARRAFKYMEHLQTTKNGRLDWVFRIVVMTLITFIAVKIGLK